MKEKKQNQFEQLKKINALLYPTNKKNKDIRIIITKDTNEISQIEKVETQSRLRTSKAILKNDFVSQEINSKCTEITEQIKEKKLIKYNSDNICEMIIQLLPSCCKTKNIEYKKNLIRESHIILDNKLDIFLYIRNMLLFDSINKIYLENKSIINFLSRPIIYLNKGEEKEEKIEEEEDEHNKKERIIEKEFYKYSYELNSKDLINEIQNLCKKPDKSDNEKDIIFFLKKKLKGV